MSLLQRVAPRTYMARRNLLRARARSALAVLTIVIGVVAIATLGAFGATFYAAQSEALGELGNQVLVTPGEDNDFYLDERQQREIQRIAGDETVAPLRQGGTTSSLSEGGVTVYWADDPVGLFEVRSGSIPRNWRNGVLVGSSLADQADVEVGQSVTVDGETHRVIAILAEQGQASVVQANDGIVVPMALAEDQRVTQVVVVTDGTREASAIAEEIRAAMNDRREVVSVLDTSQIAAQIDQIFWQINVFLLGIAGISLVVAGISIANVMLMSAIERKEEIGVLRAVGYQRTDVLGMMLAEATLLGIVGALIGLGLSTLATMGINALLLDDPLAFQAGAIRYMALAVGFGIGASLLAGLYPAWKASRQEPVEALRG